MARPNLRISLEHLVSLLVLLVLLLYTYARFVMLPYIGFSYTVNATGIITEVDSPENEPFLIQKGDKLLQIGEVEWETFIKNLRQPLLKGYQPGEEVQIRFQRGNQDPITVLWMVPGATFQRIFSRLDTIWVPYFLWLAGFLCVLVVRPRDTRRSLLIACYYLTAVWVVIGISSSIPVLESRLLMRVVIWLSLPVYLHLHWVFPQALGRLPVVVTLSIYLAGFALATLQLFQLLPISAYLYALFLTLLGCLSMLLVHIFMYPDQRRDLSLLVIAIVLVALPTIALNESQSSETENVYRITTILSLVLVSGAYFYAIYRSRLGGLELRANRAIGLLIYSVLLITTSTLFLGMLDAIFKGKEHSFSVVILLLFSSGIFTAAFYPRFQRWVEFTLLKMPLLPDRLIEDYTARILTSLDLEHLSNLLKDEIFPTLFIRQAALLRLTSGHQLEPILILNVHGEQLPRLSEVDSLLMENGDQRRFLADTRQVLPCPWACLVLPLKFDGEALGLCLLGRRDPDDIYAPTEIPILQALMDQTSLALLNIDQAIQLRAFYQSDIERHEMESTRLARDLHDDVLGQLAILRLSVEEENAPPQFLNAYQASVERVRSIISGLRPSMLQYGLFYAIDELVDDTAVQTFSQVGEGPAIQLEVPDALVRYPPEVELHLYRIVQQACQNAIKHAQARHIWIRGQLESERVELCIEDDGVGFDGQAQFDLVRLLANKNFGLAGMHERAALIGAQVNIKTAPGQGTLVQVIWCAN